MGNLCSIFHSRFKNLIKIIPSARKAQLIDYILLGWQQSLYKLKDSDKKWFMKPYSQIVADTGIPLSTLERYISELDKSGFIERRQALFSRTNEQGEFEVKKGTYICITEKLLNLLHSPESTTNNSALLPNHKDTNNAEIEPLPKHNQQQNQQQPNCLNLEKNEGIDSLILRGLYIRDLYGSFLNNNINCIKAIYTVDRKISSSLIQQFESIQNFLFTEVREEVPSEVKKLVLGTFFNLTFEHQKQFSSPKQIVAEYLFALLNIDFYLQGINCFKHRNNILSKIIRTNNWHTPKGFYKHFYLGQDFKIRQQANEMQWQKQKEQEINFTKTDMNYGVNDQRLIEIEQQMHIKSTIINELTTSIYQQSNDEITVKVQKDIKLLRIELEDLWKQQILIEKEIEQRQYLSEVNLCA